MTRQPADSVTGITESARMHLRVRPEVKALVKIEPED